MNSVASQPYRLPESNPFAMNEIKHILTSAVNVLDQTPPPSLRDILGAYKAKGDGDRDMLLAMLNAKSAEDQRLASVAALHRTMLEVYQASTYTHHPQHNSTYGPTPSFSHLPQLHDEKPYVPHHRRTSSGSRSPSRTQLPSIREASSSSQPPRKRHRSSRSPPAAQAGAYESQSASQHDRLPPSPYSSSRSDSAEYSPRSRASMAIGSLLSSGGPRRENGDDASANGQLISSERVHQNQSIPAAISV